MSPSTSCAGSSRPRPPSSPHLHLWIPGWRQIQAGRDMALWRDDDADLLGLARLQRPLRLPRLDDANAVTRYGRSLAGTMESALVQAEEIEHVEGRALLFLCRRLGTPAFAFTGILMVPLPRPLWIWSMSARCRGVIGRCFPEDERCDATCSHHPLSKVMRGISGLLDVKLGT